MEDIREESGRADQGAQMGSSPANSNDRLDEQDSPVKTAGIQGATGQDESSF